MEEVDKEISEMKLSLNARARVVAESYLLAVRTKYFLHDTACAHSTSCSSTHEALHTFSVSTSLTRVICNILAANPCLRHWMQNLRSYEPKLQGGNRKFISWKLAVSQESPCT